MQWVPYHRIETLSINKTQTKEKKSVSTLKTLEQKLEKLSSQLEVENEPAKQQELIKSIDSLIDVIAKLKSN